MKQLSQGGDECWLGCPVLLFLGAGAGKNVWTCSLVQPVFYWTLYYSCFSCVQNYFSF